MLEIDAPFRLILHWKRLRVDEYNFRGYNLLWKDEYYVRPNSDRPVEEWLEGLTKKERAGIKSKMQSLREEGFLLISIRTLRVIRNISKKDKRDPRLYELVYGQCRICTYFDTARQTFVYLRGWKKKKGIQPDDVNNCRALLHEYLARKGGYQ